MNQINTQLQELIELWVNPAPDQLQRISTLCDDLAAWAARNEPGREVDRKLLSRAELLATRAENRLAECVAIQTRTGSYAINGTQELSPSVATAGWEG
jgi:hypothetical protein